MIFFSSTLKTVAKNWNSKLGSEECEIYYEEIAMLTIFGLIPLIVVGVVTFVRHLLIYFLNV